MANDIRIYRPTFSVVAPAEVAERVAAFCDANGIATDAALKAALTGDLTAELAAASTLPQIKAVVQKMISRYGAVCSAAVSVEPPA